MQDLRPAARPRWAVSITSLFSLLALGGLGATGCLIGNKDFHPHEGDGAGGNVGGYAGYSGTGGVLPGTGGQIAAGSGGNNGNTGSGGGAPAGSGGASGTGGGGGAGTGCSTTGGGAFTVRWNIVDASQRATTCAQAGATTIDLDVLNVATSVATHDTFSCAAMAGTGSALAPGSYTVALRLRDAAGALESEAVAPTAYSITTGCTDLGNVPMEVSQAIVFSWSFDKAATGAALSCAQANVATVSVIVDGTAYPTACGAGHATTPALPPGDHAVTLKALDPQGIVLSVTNTATVTIGAGQDSALGDVVFDVN